MTLGGEVSQDYPSTISCPYLGSINAVFAVAKCFKH